MTHLQRARERRRPEGPRVHHRGERGRCVRAILLGARHGMAQGVLQDESLAEARLGQGVVVLLGHLVDVVCALA